MTDASGPAYILPSRFRKDDRMLYVLYVAILQQTFLSPYQAFGGIGERGGGAEIMASS